MKPEGYLEILHLFGKHACGKVAFYYRGANYSPGAVARSEHAMNLDGSIPAPGPIICCGCGRACNILEMHPNPCLR
jgi:hypothetical protein